ncbi:MAG: hypothetical protein K6T61_04410 [Bryobacteraceae bacterium]|nr:hypothetical protein [Bryobacteraceae bacterium]
MTRQTAALQSSDAVIADGPHESVLRQAEGAWESSSLVVFEAAPKWRTGVLGRGLEPGIAYCAA